MTPDSEPNERKHRQSRPDAQTLQTLVDELERLHERVTTLEDELTQKDDRIGHLEAELEEAHTENKDLQHGSRIAEQSRIPIEARLDAHEKKLNANKDRVGELQARELEKGAHLLEDHVDEGEIDVVDGRLERIQKDDGESYFRLPESGDPLERGGDVSLSYGDLLPSSSSRRWTRICSGQRHRRFRHGSLQSSGRHVPIQRLETIPGGRKCKRSEYVTAGDMKHWIRRQEKGISDDYAKKLVSRTIDALLDLSKSRLAVKKRTQRKNGLEYTERRVLLMDDVDIPGEMASSGDT